MFKICFACALILLHIKCFAVEGFKSLRDSPPEAVTSSFDSVFMVYFDEASYYVHGSAFLIRVEVNGETTQLDFLTGAHVLQNLCRESEVCSGLKLFQDARLNVVSGRETFVFGRPEINQVRVLKLSQNPDLALLRATIKTRQFSNPKPLAISSTCKLEIGEVLYGIGFPKTTERMTSSKVVIENQNQIIKRWSEGVFVGNLKQVSADSEYRYSLATSVDMLHGNSGGPLLNQSGKVMGVVSSGASLAENRYVYSGGESPGQLEAQSLAVPCGYLDSFLKTP